ncbi:short-chain dehydrogenase [Pseudoalteromonas citrea]|uniref:Short-chain dehydrogenase n=1 Tax=Pseudoalteromonas citrea TaxID=43655 RepID=A0A5S3XPX2_9GAMM|nr:SDR family oxidoreductase [Pseudoalteromonas citrea]TMP43987.1 short-chain dehydrogenase [Pseudoalteromonas citrea]TMP59425.1 short-chain dehydrogenase [Pseudoalteromonas citrea]
MKYQETQLIAVITGGNKGLGFAAAQQLAQLGYRVVLTARNEHSGQAAVKALAEKGLEVDFLPLDISETASISAFTSAMAARYQRCDVLINNAGVFFDWEVSASKVQLEELQTTFQTNVWGTINVTQHLMPLLHKSQQGKVINVSSDLGSLSFASNKENEYYSVSGVAYRMSKAALNMYSIALSKECEASNIAVSVVSPGWCQTDMGTDAAPRSPEQGAKSIVEVVQAPSTQFHGKFVLDGQILAW